MKKVLVSMPDELLEAIDAAVARRLTTRSAFLRSAARDALARPDPVAIRAAVGRARAAIAGLGAFESEELIRAERDTHDAAARRR
jgi:metal-responsive CopG/Arc/MetJ family transcriptional regulator